MISGILAGVLSLVVAQAVQAAEAPPPGLEDLWEEYPLDPAETVPAEPPPTVPAEPAPTPAPPAAPPPRAEEGGTSALVLVALAGAALAVLLAAVLVVNRLRGRSPPPRPVPTTPSELLAYARALAIEAAECGMVALQPPGGSKRMTETADRGGATPTAAQPGHQSASYADIGDRVADVLRAAEAAAEQIRTDARREAEGIVAVAQTEAEEARRTAEAYDTETRALVDSFASERRREAEQDVQQQLADADSQARATRQAAEAMARQIEEAGRKRGQALRDESVVVEERLKKALGGLRRMVTELDELVGAGATEPESLADALRPAVVYADGSPATTPGRDPK